MVIFDPLWDPSFQVLVSRAPGGGPEGSKKGPKMGPGGGLGPPLGGPKMTHFETPLRGCFMGIWGPKMVKNGVILGSQSGSRRGSRRGPRPPLGPQNDHFWDPILDTPISGVLIFMWELDMKWVPGPQKGSKMGVPLLTPFGSFPENHG